jgi:hypothetical protein
MTLLKAFKRLDGLRSYDVLDRPIFILSAPRSGSTFLFDLICNFEGVWGYSVETDDIWWKHFPYERLKEPSDYVGAHECRPRAVRRLRRDFYRYSLWTRQQQGKHCTWQDKLGLTRVRYLEKTIANCFHVEFLKRAFPDALYIFLMRDGRATVSSMMEGWHDPVRFTKPQLQPYIDTARSSVPHWSYSVPPGWRHVLHLPLEEICAWSWCQHVQTIARQLASVPAAQKMVLKYEDLTDRPQSLARQVGDFCGLRWREEVGQFGTRSPLSRTTVSAPDPMKWQRLHADAIRRVQPAIAPTMGELGYNA